MILLQLSAGQGPAACCKAIGFALKEIEKQCREKGVAFELVEAIATKERFCFKSVLLQLESKQSVLGEDDLAKQLAKSWQGAMLWICQSPFQLEKNRVKNKRKNWFFSGQMYEFNETELDKEVSFQTCRASGAGGQHVNTTDSAVRAIHVATGISVRVESERSQHANKRLARALLFQKLESTKVEQMSLQEKARWQQHWEVERGNSVKTFKGEKFTLVN